MELINFEGKDKRYFWDLGFGKGNQVIATTMIVNPVFDGVTEGDYTWEETIKLSEIFHNSNQPDFDENPFKAQKQLIEFSKEIKSKL